MSGDAWALAIAAIGLAGIICIVVAACLYRADAKPERRGRHAARPQHSHAKTGPDPFPDPGAADPEQAADEYVAALREEPAPFLAAPVPEPAEALPLLDQRTRPAFVITAPWEPLEPEVLSSVRDALRAWNPAPAVPQEPEPEPVTAGDDTGEIFLNLVGGDWDPAEMVRRIEQSVYGDSAPKSGSEDKAAFAGTSLPGLPGWDFTLPAVALPGGTVPAGSEESAA